MMFEGYRFFSGKNEKGVSIIKIQKMYAVRQQAMGYIFINFTNHPSDKWDSDQRQCAMKYGEIVDLPFPEVKAEADEDVLNEMAVSYVRKILELQPAAVLCQGEFCLVFQVVTMLKAHGITVLAACSERKVEEYGNKKEVTFKFVRFRKY